jgi:hypothetical protein
LLAALLFAPPAALARKPRKALKESDAKRAIAATPGFTLNRGAVRVREIPEAGASPVVVTAEVELAVHFEKAEPGKGQEPDAARWRAVEFRSGDRTWEGFDYLAAAFGAARVGAARAELEALAAEFEVKQRERQEAEKRLKGERGEDVKSVVHKAETKEEKRLREKEEKRQREEQRNRDKEAKEEKLEVRRGPLVMKVFAPMYKSARGVVTVEGAFRLEKAGGKWRVAELTVAGVSVANFGQVIDSVNAAKAARARADLDAVRAALESFRAERGFYVVAEDETVLIDHLSPRYLKTVVRVDPWNRPYRYEGTREHYTLRSDGPDGQPSTADDVTVEK